MPEKKKINMAETAVDVFEEAKQLKKKDKTTITINESSPANHCIEEQDVILPPNARCLFEIDPYLIPYKKQIHERYQKFVKFLEEIETHEPGGLDSFSRSYEQYGIHAMPDGSIHCLEWCPGAKELFLFGQFNNWNSTEWKFTKLNFGKWELNIPPTSEGTWRIPHNSLVKLIVVNQEGVFADKLSPWASYVTRYEKNVTFDHTFWNPPQWYHFKNLHPEKPNRLRIYESHVGISSSEPKIASYKHFKDNVLPRIHYLGYNCIQLMAIMEHAYYGSFGYQVTSFFACSSRYGTPTDLKELIDEAHGRGIMVLLDVVHSHASKNTVDGLNHFDGTNECFFHSNERGYHSMWQSRLFRYGEWEVVRFLLSNLRWWIDEYQFDGFRFDGVTSMLYHNHGMKVVFTGHYDEYYHENTDMESVVYIMLANYMLHKFYPSFMITIAEDVSGMPALCRPIDEGGFGFDYRMSMGNADKWIEIIETMKDEEWVMGDIVWTLINRRHGEKYVTYCECHDQALVGDQTIAFRLMDTEMYTKMAIYNPNSCAVDRGIALHKMIRLVTCGLGGESYLNFMGNEFGHPEWLDFPRAGNNESYFYARRQYHLADDSLLKYRYLQKFDLDMNHIEERFGWLASHQAFISRKHEADKVIIFERGGLVFAFNFHPTSSYPNYKIGVQVPGQYKIVLDSDSIEYYGHNRLDHNSIFFTFPEPWDNRDNHIYIYLPNRTALVFAKLQH